MNSRQLIKFAITVIGLMVIIPIVFLLATIPIATCCIDNPLFELWLFFPVYAFIVVIGWAINKVMRDEFM